MKLVVKWVLFFCIILFAMTMTLFLSDCMIEDMRLERMKDQEPLGTKYLYKSDIPIDEISRIIVIGSLRDKDQVESYYKSGEVAVSLSDYQRPPMIISSDQNKNIVTCELLAYVLDSTYAIIKKGDDNPSTGIDERRIGYVSVKYIHDTLLVK